MFNRKWVRGLVIIPVTLAAYLAGSRFPAGLPSDYAVASPDAEASAVTRLEPDPADAAVGHVRALSATPTVTPNDVVASRSSDLPAADVPVLQLIEQLEPRARRGDARRPAASVSNCCAVASTASRRTSRTCSSPLYSSAGARSPISNWTCSPRWRIASWHPGVAAKGSDLSTGVVPSNISASPQSEAMHACGSDMSPSLPWILRFFSTIWRNGRAIEPWRDAIWMKRCSQGCPKPRLCSRACTSRPMR